MDVGGTGVSVGGTGVFVGGPGVDVGGTGVKVGGTGVDVGVAWGVLHAARTITIKARPIPGVKAFRFILSS